MLVKGELVEVVSMDLSKAFDVIDLLLAKLKVYGVGERSFVLFIKEYLSRRQQRVKIGDTFFNWKGVIRGVPQGSVLGPVFFFNIFISELHMPTTISYTLLILTQ